MKMNRLYLVIAVSLIVLIKVSLSYINNPSYQLNSDVWWNDTWHYRVKMDINSTSYERVEWPVEYDINFTSLISQANRYETLNASSIRVFEYNSSGYVKYAVPYQFDQGDGYNAANNAVGTLVFLLNGTTSANQRRRYYVYFDTVENGIKPNVTYPTSLAYNYTTEEFHVNTTELTFYVDTKRGQNVSGIYRIKGMKEPQLDIFSIPSESENTIEYLRYSNGTHNFTFNFINNFTFIPGPIRLTVEQKGYENIWNSSTQTNEGFVTKRYYFYDGKPWVKIEHKFTNIAGYDIVRNSTTASAVSFDAERAFGSTYGRDGNSTEPFSWYFARDQDGTYHLGFVNINQTGTSGFYAGNDSSTGKIGITLNSTTIQSNKNITNTILVHVNDTEADSNQVKYLKYRYENAINITQGNLEFLRVDLQGSTNHTIYNRNETIVISLNASYDPFNKTAYANVTLDMGTPSTSDDQIIQLYDNGSGYDGTANDNVFVNSFNLNNTSATGPWTINFTVYQTDGLSLNTTTITFGVTNILNITTSILNKEGLVNRLVNSTVTVKNYREDTLLSNAVINCTCPGTTIYSNNITDFGNGTYFVNFTAPDSFGTSTLNCSASRIGNEGWDTDTFSTEPSLTYGNITVNPTTYTATNITLYNSENFTFSSNLTNIGNGTMRFTNITLTLPSGWQSNSTYQNCNNITPSGSCLKSFEVKIPTGTVPGNYLVYSNGTWQNPDGTVSNNQTYVNVTVLSNPKINITQTLISGNAGDGLSQIIGNFTVFSWGNDNLTDINFSSSGFSSNFTFNFIPANISLLSPSSSQNISINVSVAQDTDPSMYSGLIFANSSNDGSDNVTLQITLVNKTYINISVTPGTESISGISLSNRTFNFTTTLNNTGIAIAKSTNITLTLPSGWESNSSFENCYNITPSNLCEKSFEITIPKGELPGSYYVYSNATWRNSDGTISNNQTYVNVTILANPIMEIVESSISANVSDGVAQVAGNFTIKSTGNENLLNITFQTINLTDFTVNYNPSTISSITAGTNQTVLVNVSVSVGYPSDTYNGTINVTAQNYGSIPLDLQLFVLENRTWNMTSTTCIKVTVPYVGTACEVVVTNRGNTQINFTISPATGNQTAVNITSFVLSLNSSNAFNVTYNVTSNPDLIYNSIFLVDALQAGSNPDNMTLNVSLVPLTEPVVNASVSPNKNEQNGTVEIIVNVTDKTNQGIQWVKVNVTMPNGTINQFNMTQVNLTGVPSNFTSWSLVYPNTSGSTNQRGEYFVQAYVRDNIGNTGGSNTTFKIYTKLLPYLTTLSERYYQGDTGSIYYVVRNSSGDGLSGTNVTFEIKNPNQNLTYSENRITGSYGSITPLPSFTLSTDSVVGNYTLFANATYYDDLVQEFVYNQYNYTFLVIPKVVTVSGLFAEVETSITWFPDNVMKLGVIIYDGEGKPVDPDTINITVYDPAENIYFSVAKGSFTRETVGYYSYKHSLGNIASGMYLIHLNVTKGDFITQNLKAFRISRGGVYDVSIILPKHEVYQGDYLDLQIVIVNMGDISQDVLLKYWVSSGNQTWFTKSEAVYTPANYNQTFTRQAYIFSNQPVGNYFINLDVTYDNVQPPVSANLSFSVLTRPNVTTTTVPPSPPGQPPTQAPTSYVTEKWAAAPPKKSEISIINYRETVELAQGWNTTIPITIKNTGETTLDNVTLFILGIPVEWYSIKPESLIELSSGNISVFLVEFSIPKNAPVGEYDFTLTAMSNKTMDKKMTKLTVYGSIEGLLRDQIDKVSVELEKLRTEIEVARKTGKDITDVTLFLDEIQAQIRLAEQNLANKNYDEGLKNIYNAKNIIERARGLLYEKISVRERPNILLYIIPLVLILVIISMIIFFILYKRKTGKKILFPALERIGSSLKIPKVQNEDLLKEKEKLKRMSDLIETERREKIISKNVYNELKKDIEKKLSEIEKKLK